jgi:hypothetical protein
MKTELSKTSRSENVGLHEDGIDTAGNSRRKNSCCKEMHLEQRQVRIVGEKKFKADKTCSAVLPARKYKYRQPFYCIAIAVAGRIAVHLPCRKAVSRNGFSTWAMAPLPSAWNSDDRPM